MLANLISAARQELWQAQSPNPVSFTVGRKHLRCTDAVMTMPGVYKVKKVTPTTLEVSGKPVCEWVNANLDAIQTDIVKKKMNVMPYYSTEQSIKLSGPWNCFDTELRATADKLQVNDLVQIRACPAIAALAPSEFRILLRAVDVKKVIHG